VDGFFIAEQYSQRGDISEADYAAFAKPYTDDLLAYIKDRTWFNILHAHGHVDLAVERFIDYDVQAINWEDGSDHAEDPTRLSFRKLRALTDKLLVGGISPKTDLTFSNQAQEIEDLLVDRLADVLAETGDTGIVFAPGCAISLEANPDFYQRIHAAAQKVQATILKTANH
jgi:uroporphyrinogen decarboxylase